MILDKTLNMIRVKINAISTLIAEIEILEDELFSDTDNLIFRCFNCGDILHYGNHGILDDTLYCLKHYKQAVAEDMK